MPVIGKPPKPYILSLGEWSFTHLKHKNLSAGDDFIHRSGMSFLVPYLATKEAVALLANDPIMLGR